MLFAVQDYYKLFLPLLTLSILLSKFITQRAGNNNKREQKKCDVQMIHILSAENCQRKKKCRSC